MDFEVNMVGRYLVECFPTFFTAPAVSSNSMRSQVDVDTVSCFELLSTLFTTEGPVIRMLEEDMKLHMSLSVELSWAVRTVIV